VSRERCGASMADALAIVAASGLNPPNNQKDQEEAS
jgi:hypothetical protein